MGQSPLDARSDLYSVGILLYQTLTGRLPFDAPNEIDVLTAQVRSEPVPPSSVNPIISPELDRIVLTALEKDPNKRFASAKEFRAALAAPGLVQQPSHPIANRPNQVFPDSDIQPKPRRRFAVPLLCGSLAVAISVGIIVWLAIH